MREALDGEEVRVGDQVTISSVTARHVYQVVKVSARFAYIALPYGGDPQRFPRRYRRLGWRPYTKESWQKYVCKIYRA